jgi:hypothetical protein
MQRPLVDKEFRFVVLIDDTVGASQIKSLRGDECVKCKSCVFRSKVAMHSGGKVATDSGVKVATHSGGRLPPLEGRQMGFPDW